jgi:hypothetical protein
LQGQQHRRHERPRSRHSGADLKLDYFTSRRDVSNAPTGEPELDVLRAA